MAKKTNVNALLAKAAKTTSGPKKKSTCPIIAVDDENVALAISEWRDAKQRAKQAENEMGLSGAIIIQEGSIARRKYIQSYNRTVSSIKLVGNDEETVTLSVKSSSCYSKIPADNAGDLKKIFAKDFDKCFQVKTNVRLTDEAAADMNIISKLIEVFGEKQFLATFEVEQTLMPTPQLIIDRDLDPKIAMKHDSAAKQGLISPHKPSLKL